MLTVERYNLILKLIEEKQNIKVHDIVEKLKISEATARRDLNFLEDKGKIKRIHGGAVLVETKEEDIGFKKLVFNKEKDIIAKKSIKFIHEGDTIFLDAGTTTFALIKYLKDIPNIKIVTNGYSHINELTAINKEVYLLGGKLKKKTGALVGFSAMNSLKTYNFDVVFIGANGVNTEGYSTPDEEEVLVKSEAIKRGKRIYFLCDHTKFKTKSFFNFASLNDGDLISDTDLPKEITKAIDKAKK
ncbi:MAG: DeoR/GlpR family DNA-binding transcription regulator [Fusobacterium sp. JB021]|nr:DeoR/GlpR family DNA-binding transcription regulator [Fusobacterium sp. JB021]MDP0506643.1 DeoR/GlpR family DNA-binding transcription regulator [Fusobacterium sp. JB019]